MKFELDNGKEIQIKPLQEINDVFALCDFVNETRENSRFLGTDEPVDPENEADWLENRKEEIEESEYIYLAALDGDKIIGSSSVECKDGRKSHTAEAGVMIREKYRGNGLGTFMLKKAVEKARENPKMEVIYLKVFSPNKKAEHIYKKIGFEEVARLPKFFKSDEDDYGDEIWMILK